MSVSVFNWTLSVLPLFLSLSIQLKSFFFRLFFFVFVSFLTFFLYLPCAHVLSSTFHIFFFLIVSFAWLCVGSHTLSICFSIRIFFSLSLLISLFLFSLHYPYYHTFSSITSQISPHSTYYNLNENSLQAQPRQPPAANCLSTPLNKVEQSALNSVQGLHSLPFCAPAVSPRRL